MFVIALALAAGTARAETVLLLQGYLSGPGHWRDSGVTRHLSHAGWDDAGTLRAQARGVRADRHQPPASGRRFFTVELASMSSLLAQVGQLDDYVSWVRARYPRGPLILIGHSAGGVLGRLFMVQRPHAAVSALITVASPHLGTPLADFGVYAGDHTLSWLAPYVGGGDLGGLIELLRELKVEEPGSFLYTLNRQPHPAARYISVVRTPGERARGDLFIPEWSQDLGRVQALRGRARIVRVPGEHALGPADGPLLVRLLRFLRQT